MKYSALFLVFGLFMTSTYACATVGESCASEGDTACECNEGYLLKCEVYLAPEIDGEGGETEALYTRVKNCPVPADGGLQCSDGACTS